MVNIARIKPFLEEPNIRLSQDDSSPFQDSPNGLDQGQLTGLPKRPMTRAFQKLQDLKNAASLAIAILQEDNCDGNPFADNFDKNHCSNCRNGIRNFLQMPNLKQFLQQFYVGPICSAKTVAEDIYSQNVASLFKECINNVHSKPETPAEENLINNDGDQTHNALLLKTKNNVHSAADPARNQTLLLETKNNVSTKADPNKILPIKEELRSSLLSIASKLLTEQHLTLDQLSQEEQDLWNSYDNRDIYEFLTGEKDTHPEFRFDWIVTDPKLRLPHDWKDFILPPAQPKQPQAQAPPVIQPPPPLPAPIPDQIPPALPQVQPAPPAAPQCDRVLHNKPPVDYKELHTGIKRKCRTLR